MSFRNIILVTLTTLLMSTAAAQIHSGVYSVKGSASYSTYSYSIFDQQVKMSIISLTPAITYFVHDNIELNWSVEMSEVRSTGPGYDNTNSSTILSIGFRGYLPLEEYALFAGAGLGTKNASNDLNTLYEAGVDLFVSRSVALEPLFQYSLLQDFQKTKVLRAALGFRYFIE